MKFAPFTSLAVISALLFSTPVLAGNNKGGEAFNAGDYATAISEWTSAARRGDARAPYNLGVLYENGLANLPRDVNQAMSWYLLGARRGDLPSMVAIGRTQIAAGLTVDGLSWLNLAARWNDSDAIEMLQRLNQPIPEPDLLIAKRQADDQAAAMLGYSLGCALAGGCAANQPGTTVAPTTRGAGLPKWIRRSWHDAGHTMCEYADGTVLNVGSKSCPSYIYGNGY